MRYNGVIFDLDGTLVNSLEDIADSMNAVLKTYGFPTHAVDEYKSFVGRGMTHLVISSLPEDARDEARIALCRDAMLAEYGVNYLNKTRPYDGIIDLVTELSRMNIERAVFSNKVDHLTKKIVAELFPDCHFAIILGSGPELPEKPDPKGVLAISSRVKIAPENLIYVGDSDVDMQTARNAGMSPAGALWGFRTKEELISNGAEYLLHHPMDLLPILQ
ncbi:MAG: family hydrolase [Deltaproteobacteria bacterium]|nr:family hydrolase [Deltaproteobacteria bacterium]